jgi:chromosome segregation ATPase
MGDQPNSSVHYLPEASRAIHADIMAEITRTPEESRQAGSNSPEGVASNFDVSGALGRIESAYRHLELCSERIQELEAVVEKLNQREAELVTQLQEAKQRSADLEERLAAEKQHSARAEGLAAAVSARANELEQALWDANQNLETLGGALEVAFRGLPEATDRNLAAA